MHITHGIIGSDISLHQITKKQIWSFVKDKRPRNNLEYTHDVIVTDDTVLRDFSTEVKVDILSIIRISLY